MIRVEHLTKRFGSFVAVNDVSFEVGTGALVALLGPSGSGKSTILRIIAGLDKADSGQVWINGEAVTELEPAGRRIGFVFQHYALFRHMTVQDNVEFGLRVQGVPPEQRAERSSKLLRMVGLQGLGMRLPQELSGGQRQRVALARALAPEPRVLLLDEPFAAVDAKVREDLRQWLSQLHDKIGVTSVFVTHDQEEAFSLADRVVVVQGGKIEQEGTPGEILDNPKTEFIAGFIGAVNTVEAVVKASKAMVGSLAIPVEAQPDGTRLRIFLRSYDLKFWAADGAGVATVRRMVTFGDRVRVDADIDHGPSLFAQFPRRSSLLTGLRKGSRIAIEPTKFLAFPAGAAAPGEE